MKQFAFLAIALLLAIPAFAADTIDIANGSVPPPAVTITTPDASPATDALATDRVNITAMATPITTPTPIQKVVFKHTGNGFTVSSWNWGPGGTYDSFFLQLSLDDYTSNVNGGGKIKTSQYWAYAEASHGGSYVEGYADGTLSSLQVTKNGDKTTVSGTLVCSSYANPYTAFVVQFNVAWDPTAGFQLCVGHHPYSDPYVSIMQSSTSRTRDAQASGSVIVAGFTFSLSSTNPYQWASMSDVGDHTIVKFK